VQRACSSESDDLNLVKTNVKEVTQLQNKMLRAASLCLSCSLLCCFTISLLSCKAASFCVLCAFCCILEGEGKVVPVL
jgi:hypothetical protein